VIVTASCCEIRYLHKPGPHRQISALALEHSTAPLVKASHSYYTPPRSPKAAPVAMVVRAPPTLRKDACVPALIATATDHLAAPKARPIDTLRL